jgi:hypothetical protein
MSSAFYTIFIVFEIAPKRVQLSLSEKNAIAALHKASLKGPTITWDTRCQQYIVFKNVLDNVKLWRASKERSGRPSLLTPPGALEICMGLSNLTENIHSTKLLIFSMGIGLDLYLIELFKEFCMKPNITSGFATTM